MSCPLLNRAVDFPGVVLALALAASLGSVGCLSTDVAGLPQPLPDREERMERGYLFYLDGAGGGTAKKNWAGGVKDGLLAAGYQGAGEMYSWEKGEGMMKDQTASIRYKRNMATGLAFEIEQYRKEHPDAPIGILGFSAGTAEAIFALEALPDGIQVDRVVLLGASISNSYDLTEALEHVKDKIYVYTSTHDKMLKVLMPMSVTADDLKGVPGAGIDGFVLPAGATDETRELYASKVVTVRWSPALEEDGDQGRHFDNVEMPFIRDHVAPLFMGKPVPLLP